MSRRNESIGELIVKAPWWVAATLAVIAFVGLRWILPTVFEGNPVLKPFALGLPKLAPLAAFVFGMLACGSALFGVKRRRLVDEQESLETLKGTSWKDFEYLVAEAYRRQGFRVEYSMHRGADGGIDLVLQKDARTSLVQCKQWKTQSVGAPVIRELFGLMTAEHADEAIIVTSGHFTREAETFAAGKPITLVDGPKLLVLVKSVQRSSNQPEPSVVVAAKTQPGCPNCGKTMVQRTSRRGARIGEQFWGCSDFPRCKGTRPA